MSLSLKLSGASRLSMSTIRWDAHLSTTCTGFLYYLVLTISVVLGSIDICWMNLTGHIAIFIRSFIIQWDNHITNASEIWIHLWNTEKRYLERPKKLELKLRFSETIRLYSFLRLCRLEVDDLIRYLEIFDLYDPRVDFNVENRGDGRL